MYNIMKFKIKCSKICHAIHCNAIRNAIYNADCNIAYNKAKNNTIQYNNIL